MVTAISFHVEEERRRLFRRLLAGSVLAHALILLLVSWAPSWHQPMMLPGVVSVDLIAAPSLSPPGGTPAPAAPAKPKPKPAPAAKPEAKPLPKPVPPKPKPAPSKQVLPKEATREAVKPAPRAVETPTEKAPAKAEKAYEDVMAELRKEEGDSEPVAESAPKAAVPGAAAGGLGTLVSPEVAAWLRDARNHVRQVWVLAAAFRQQPLETHVEVELDAAGRVIGEPEITRSSGNPWYDESVVRAILKASPLPAPPQSGTWPFVFRPEESL